jgi:hypothetical protein
MTDSERAAFSATFDELHHFYPPDGWRPRANRRNRRRRPADVLPFKPRVVE